jgi:hypothetical protein
VVKNVGAGGEHSRIQNIKHPGIKKASPKLERLFCIL